ncbi:MAG: bile acid:sodium symporter family protein [Planctomycetales bacterium]|nr:bile acid:sodium symporter family protein [Planctomycetales bacterium]MCB0186815.1 bile acid:sodium symporter family protein [Caldilineaceae bacterium]
MTNSSATDRPGQQKTSSLTGVGLLVGLACSSSLAYFWPNFASLWTAAAQETDGSATNAWDPFHVSPNFLWLLVATTMLCLGMVLQRSELSELRERPGSVFLGLLAQCGCMPILAWLVVHLAGFTGELAAGIILVGCVPGAMASNVLTMAARGNVSFSVSLTVVATMLSPVTVPVALLVFGGIAAENGGFDLAKAASTAKFLGVAIVLPVVAGFAARECLPQIKPYAARIAPGLACIALLWIIASVVADNRQRLAQISGYLLLALLLINLAGYVSGYCIGRLARMSPAMLRALSLEVGMQNAGVGTALAATLYGAGTPAQIPTAAYTFGCMLTGTLLASFWAARPIVDDSAIVDAKT